MSAKQFFFDYPLIDVQALACSALKLIYHGSTKGAFGNVGLTKNQHTKIDLDEIEAFRISLNHLSSPQLSLDYEYSLVYVTKDLGDHLWDGEKRTLAPDLKQLTRRVQLGEKASLSAKRYKTPFWVRFLRPIYLAKIDLEIVNDHYVPQGYYKAFHLKYQGFLMRSKVNYPLVRNLFEAYGLELSDRREVKDHIDGNLQILSYKTRVGL